MTKTIDVAIATEVATWSAAEVATRAVVKASFWPPTEIAARNTLWGVTGLAVGPLASAAQDAIAAALTESAREAPAFRHGEVSAGGDSRLP